MSYGLPAQVATALLQLVDSQRYLAYAVADDSAHLVRLGGHLEHYGLAGLRLQAGVAQQLPFVEGMLPLIESPFLIRSMEMPSGRIADVHFFADGYLVWIVLLDTTAEHREAQRVQQKAYDMTLLSEREAKLIAELEAANTELTRAHGELAESRKALQAAHDELHAELNFAARYVRACLPEPFSEPVEVDWLYVPATQLGGDSFGYHWLDQDQFAIYLLDVCGHGIGSALLSVAANQTLRSRALLDVDFSDPEAVLQAMNEVYQMERHDNLFFTMWYGVYHRPSGALRYASAGHTAPLLVSGPADKPTGIEELKSRGPAIGMSPLAHYRSETCVVAPPSRLYLFSDGVYEISRPDGSMLEFEAFTKILSQPRRRGESELDALLDFARATHGADTLEDDFSIVKIQV
jgi:serine phosphatase RsbU (regulator of sigma subunit)